MCNKVLLFYDYDLHITLLLSKRNKVQISFILSLFLNRYQGVDDDIKYWYL